MLHFSERICQNDAEGLSEIRNFLEIDMLIESVRPSIKLLPGNEGVIIPDNHMESRINFQKKFRSLINENHSRTYLCR